VSQNSFVDEKPEKAMVGVSGAGASVGSGASVAWTAGASVGAGSSVAPQAAKIIEMTIRAIISEYHLLLVFIILSLLMHLLVIVSLWPLP
jgi:hypothetical protein